MSTLTNTSKWMNFISTTWKPNEWVREDQTGLDFVSRSIITSAHLTKCHSDQPFKQWSLNLKFISVERWIDEWPKVNWQRISSIPFCDRLDNEWIHQNLGILPNDKSIKVRPSAESVIDIVGFNRSSLNKAKLKRTYQVKHNANKFDPFELQNQVTELQEIRFKPWI